MRKVVKLLQARKPRTQAIYSARWETYAVCTWVNLQSLFKQGHLTKREFDAETLDLAEYILKVSA